MADAFEENLTTADEASDEEVTIILEPDKEITLDRFDNSQLRLIASLGNFEILIKGVEISSLGGFDSKKWLIAVKKIMDDFKSSDPTFSILAFTNGKVAAKTVSDFICNLTVHINQNINSNPAFTFMGENEKNVIKEVEAFCTQLRNLLEG